MKIDLITVHCSDSPHGRGDDAETIHRWHLERGWSGIGYHYVITEAGEVQPGRPPYWKGSHVKGHNSANLGICLIGGLIFTEKQLKSLKALLIELLADHPGARIVGHCDLDAKKTCPNFEVGKWIVAQGITE